MYGIYVIVHATYNIIREVRLPNYHINSKLTLEDSDDFLTKARYNTVIILLSSLYYGFNKHPVSASGLPETAVHIQ